MRVGIAHHFGWAAAVTASDDHRVVDRRRIELIEPGLSVAPIHYNARALDDRALEALVVRVRASATKSASAALDKIASAVGGSIQSISVRAWPLDFPEDIPTLRRSPFEAQADSVMYRQVLAGAARERGWAVHLFEAAEVEARAAAILGAQAREVLYGPRDTLGPPWTKDHRMALAATVVAAAGA